MRSGNNPENRANWRVAMAAAVGFAGGSVARLGIDRLIDRIHHPKIEEPYGRLKTASVLDRVARSSEQYVGDLELILSRFAEARQLIILPNTPDSDVLDKTEAKFRIPFLNIPADWFADYSIVRGNQNGSSVLTIRVIHGIGSTGETWPMLDEQFVDGRPTKRTYSADEWPIRGHSLLTSYTRFAHLHNRSVDSKRPADIMDK